MAIHKNIKLLLFLLVAINCQFVLCKEIKGLYIEKGILDLSSYQLNNKDLIKLQGESEFYWKKLLTPNDFNLMNKPQPDGYIEIPGIWNRFKINGRYIGGTGYATYRFFIKMNNKNRYGIKIKEFDCAYKIWINGILIDSVGKVATEKNKEIPSWQRKEIYFSSTDSLNEIILQISNFHHRKGGAEDMMIFGTAKAINNYKKSQFGKDVFLTGILFIMFFFYFVIFLLRRKEIPTLLFCLSCFLMFLRLITINEKILIDFIPNFNWNLAVKIEYLSYTLFVPVFLGFFYSYYPKYFSLKIIKIFAFFALIFSALYIITPVKIFSYTPIVYQFIVFIAGIYCLYCLIKAFLKNENFTILFLISYLIFFAIIINDILSYNKFISSGYLIPLGLMIMIFSQSIVVSVKLFNAYNQVEHLTSELNKQNNELEEIIKERTEKINAQNEEILAQTEKLYLINKELMNLVSFKENMTNMVVHDIKNHLNHIILATEIKNQDIKNINTIINHSARQILNLVMNILDIQRFEEAKIELKLQKTSMYNIVNNAIKVLEVSASQKNINIKNKCAKEIMVNVDSAIMERVFINLIYNAIKFSDTNGEIIIISEKKENIVRFCVIDYGKGISEANKLKIFEKYYKSNDDNNELKSTGLGLAFCKLAVEAHNGEIGVESNRDKGSIFWFTLPLYEEVAFDLLTFEAEVFESYSNLKADEITYLAPFCQKLKNIKFYEVTFINKIIEEINSDHSENVKLWINNLKKAVYYGKKDAYESLINAII